jgi:apolipoprotein D and lipocalin family protein
VVIDLDPDYRWSAVGHPSRGYGWVLACVETLDAADLQRVADSFRAAGYDACEILMSPRSLGAPRSPLCEVAPPR